MPVRHVKHRPNRPPWLDPAVQAGVDAFDARDFRGAHEVWEAGWRVAQGPERDLFHSLAQLSAAFLKWHGGRATGAATLFGRARRHLGALPSTLLGVEVSDLELQLGAWEEAAARGEPAPASPRLVGVAASPPVAPTAHRAQCPYCGEAVQVQAEPFGVAEESYVEDCPVCCRPWTVHLSRAADALLVRLSREDD